MKPLSRLRVLVTRPAAQSRGLRRRLERLGARVLSAPVIRTAPPRSWAPLDRALRSFGPDILVFTSANGVERFFARAGKPAGRRLKRPPALEDPIRPRGSGKRMRPAEVWAIGPATARALRRRGLRRVLCPRVHEGGALARTILSRHRGRLGGRRVLLPRAERARPVLPRMLRRAGAEVRVVPVYRTVTDVRGLRRIRRAARQDGADWVTFTSSSTVEHLLRALGPDAARRFFRRARAVSIGPVTSRSLVRRGIRPAAEARPYTDDGLVRALLKRSRTEPVRRLRKTLVSALRAGGGELKARFGRVALRYKGRANIVTAADHASEQRILDVILRRHPSHGYVTEERPPREGRSDYVWYIDPLDGTTNYAHGFPHCCVSIALLHRGSPLLAGIHDPFRDETFLAQRGHGAALNGRRLRVSRTRRLSESLLLTGFAYDRIERSRYYIRFYREFMERSHDVRRCGSASLDLAWTAAGRADAFWEFNLQPWDVAAGWLLVTEAGGTVSDFRGRDWSRPEDMGPQTLATNGRIRRGMLGVFRRRLGRRPRS